CSWAWGATTCSATTGCGSGPSRSSRCTCCAAGPPRRPPARSSPARSCPRRARAAAATRREAGRLRLRTRPRGGMAKSSFLNHAAVYGAGNLLVSAAGLLLLPLYERCLSEAEYGTLDVFNRLGDVVLLFLLSNGLQQGLISFHNLARDEAE